MNVNHDEDDGGNFFHSSSNPDAIHQNILGSVAEAFNVAVNHVSRDTNINTCINTYTYTQFRVAKSLCRRFLP